MLIDESTTISGKSVLVVCLRSAIANAEPDTIFFDLLELDGTTANDITEKLLACLHKMALMTTSWMSVLCHLDVMEHQ